MEFPFLRSSSSSLSHTLIVLSTTSIIFSMMLHLEVMAFLCMEIHSYKNPSMENLYALSCHLVDSIHYCIYQYFPFY